MDHDLDPDDIARLKTARADAASAANKLRALAADASGADVSAIDRPAELAERLVSEIDGTLERLR